MSEFMFCNKHGKMTKREQQRHERVARRASKEYGHTVMWVYGNFPGNGWMSWFVGPNYGAPFDGQLHNMVRDMLDGKKED